MTGDEVRLILAAENYIQDLHHPVFHATLSDRSLTEWQFRALSRKFKNRLALEQRRRGINPIYIEVLEGSPQLHSHILFPIPAPKADACSKRLEQSKIFNQDGILIKEAKRPRGFVAYVSKEREAKSAYIPGIQMTKRRPGKHALGQGGGERVRLSKHLESQLLADGKIPPRKRTNAKKSPALLTPPSLIIHNEKVTEI